MNGLYTEVSPHTKVSPHTNFDGRRENNTTQITLGHELEKTCNLLSIIYQLEEEGSKPEDFEDIEQDPDIVRLRELARSRERAGEKAEVTTEEIVNNGEEET